MVSCSIHGLYDNAIASFVKCMLPDDIRTSVVWQDVEDYKVTTFFSCPMRLHVHSTGIETVFAHSAQLWCPVASNCSATAFFLISCMPRCCQTIFAHRVDGRKLKTAKQPRFSHQLHVAGRHSHTALVSGHSRRLQSDRVFPHVCGCKYRVRDDIRARGHSAQLCRLVASNCNATAFIFIRCIARRYSHTPLMAGRWRLQSGRVYLHQIH